jgi:transcriptional regulator with XRE-family HTH domain
MANRSLPNQRTTVFGTTLRAVRLAAGLSQGALAERAGISEKAVGALERGDRITPRLATVARLADALNASPAERARLLAAAHGSNQQARGQSSQPARGIVLRLPPAGYSRRRHL